MPHYKKSLTIFYFQSKSSLIIPQSRCFCLELKAVSRIWCLGSKKSRCLSQSKKSSQRYSRESPESRLLSGVLRPWLEDRSDSDSSGAACASTDNPENTDHSPQTPAPKHNTGNAARRSNQTRCFINIQDSPGASTAHARPRDSLSDCALQLSLHKARFYCHLRINFSSTIT